MGHTDDIDLVAAFKKLLATSKSQEGRLEDYAKVIYNRDNEIEMLQTMLNEANEYRSSIDAQVKELKEFKSYMNGLQQQASGAVYAVTGSKRNSSENVSMEQLFENLQQEYAYLQTQLTDLQSQLLDANNRNTILQIKASRIAEMESLLLIAEEEIDELKEKINAPEC